jgi:hypothetical protein
MPDICPGDIFDALIAACAVEITRFNVSPGSNSSAVARAFSGEK